MLKFVHDFVDKYIDRRNSDHNQREVSNFHVILTDRVSSMIQEWNERCLCKRKTPDHSKKNSEVTLLF